ncbi:MAG: FG-GAP repeat domain-containing protein, partial [Pyrinomonadaceae bacterium]
MNSRLITEVITTVLCGLSSAGFFISVSQEKKDRSNSSLTFPVRFVDVAERGGLSAPIIYGGLEQKRYIIEANGCGVAFVDYDDDGWVDILLLSGSRLEGFANGKTPTNRLYRNNHDGTFIDVTTRAGLEHTGWASGVCVGDYDNDGYDDLFITYWGRNVLYHNNGNGTFRDVTQKAGVATKSIRWGSGSSFIDFDRDGDLDLFVANYLKFDLATAPEPGKDNNCRWKGIAVNCGPRGLPTDTNLFYRNNGDGTFTDISESSGIARVRARYSMTAVVIDYNNDGWPDIYV